MPKRILSWLVTIMLCAAAVHFSQAAGGSWTAPNDQGEFLYLIEFAEPGLLAQTHRAQGERFTTEASDTQAALARLQSRQREHHRAMQDTVGRVLDITHHYLVTHSGMAVWLSPAEADSIARLPDVLSVEREREYRLATFRGPWFIGADAVWNGTAVPNASGLRGEGMVIGILDTGVQVAHPSFANDPSCSHGSDNVANKLLSAQDCSTTDESGMCNGGAPGDTVGHGTHVASTAGGNRLDSDTLPPPEPQPPFSEISGVAPCAHIRSYKVCPSTMCNFAQIQAGMNSILLHGDVDVMNFSISGGNHPWQDNDRRKLDLVDAGVLVAAAAGNTSGSIPNPVGAVGHLGPWVLSVASVTHDGTGSGLLSVSGPGTPPPQTLNMAAVRGSGQPAALEITDLPIRHFAGQPPEVEGCTPDEDGAPDDLQPFPDGFFEGAAALVQRGVCPFSTKIANAFAAGAELVIVRNNVPGELQMTTTGDAPVPAYSIDMDDGLALQGFVAMNPTDATIDFSPIEGDVLSVFSLRGPTPEPLQNLTKPDIAAPGDAVYAAVPGGYATSGGTSMASPHAAGAAALVRQAHPDWSVPEVNSALMMTAWPEGFKEDLLTPSDADDIGSGRVDLTGAVLAGLVMHETAANYLAANPAADGDVRTLNLPSLRDVDCTPNCTWTRTVRNTLDMPSNWSITAGSDDVHISVWPSTFSFVGDVQQTRELTITATPVGNQSAAVVFSELWLVEANDLAPPQRIPVAVRGEGDPSFALTVQPERASVCLPMAGEIQIPVDVQLLPVGEYTGTADLSVALLPAGISGVPVPDVVPVPGSALWEVSVAAAAGAGHHLLGLTASDGNTTRQGGLALRLDEPLTDAPVLHTPVDAAADLTLRPQFSWQALNVPELYRLQVALDPGFSDLVIDRPVSRQDYTPDHDLDLGTEYFWRVRGTNACGDSDWSDPRSFTTRLEPVAQITPNDFTFTIQPGEGGDGTVHISNTGTGNLVWSIAAAGTVADFSMPLAALDETLHLPDFSITSPVNSGVPVEFQVAGGLTSRGEVTGLEFGGTAAGLDGNFSLASDTCMIARSPGGSVFAVGGVHGTHAGCGERAWAFQGTVSDSSGPYASSHLNAYLPAVADSGQWTFTFVNDWESVTAADIEWSGVSITLYKTPWPYCADPGEIDWLTVATVSGSVVEGGNDTIAISVDSTGLDEGNHFAALCLSTNDPGLPIVTIPVLLRVIAGAGEIFSDRFEPE